MVSRINGAKWAFFVVLFAEASQFHQESGEVGRYYADGIISTTDSLGRRCDFHNIAFDQPFAFTPEVSIAISQCDLDSSRNIRYIIKYTNVTPSGFRIAMCCWANTLMYHASVQWVAFGN